MKCFIVIIVLFIILNLQLIILKIINTLIQWRFYIRGRWGTAPPDPDGAVVQKAQYIRTLRQNIFYIMFYAK